jgi:7-cyano-7-deazaguanine synthase
MATSQRDKSRVVVIFSGGLDSTTAVYDALDQEFDVDLVSFNYGQKHKKELDYATATALTLGLRHDICDLSGIAPLLAEGGSALVGEAPVPEGHYAQDNMKQTVVPNRNMIMLSIAGALAVARNAEYVITGVHAGDHAVYPDCRPPFIDRVSDALVLGNSGFGNLHGVIAPYVRISKTLIARKAILLRVPFEETWSCYKGGETHCGRCGTCVERLESIHEAIEMLKQEGSGFVIAGTFEGQTIYKDYDQIDKTKYEDSEFWKTATPEGNNDDV